MTTTYWTTVDSPVGTLLLTSDGTRADPAAASHRSTPDPDLVGRAVRGARRRRSRSSRDYFAGERTEFDLPLEPAGTPFQQTVWQALREIPYAETINYGQLATRVGNPTASRAVGLANGRNPIAIVVPCHRVIGADGSLTGYGGGLDRKRLLLDLERPGRRALDDADQLSLL